MIVQARYAANQSDKRIINVPRTWTHRELETYLRLLYPTSPNQPCALTLGGKKLQDSLDSKLRDGSSKFSDYSLLTFDSTASPLHGGSNKIENDPSVDVKPVDHQSSNRGLLSQSAEE